MPNWAMCRASRTNSTNAGMSARRGPVDTAKRYCQVAALIGETSDAPPSHITSDTTLSYTDWRRTGYARDLRPLQESPGYPGPVIARPHTVATRAEMVRHLCMRRQKALRLPHRLESAHGSFSQARRLVRVLRPVV